MHRKLGPCFLLLIAITALWAADNANVSIKEWDVPTPNARPHDPALAPDGSLWVTEQMANKLGRLDPRTVSSKSFPLRHQNRVRTGWWPTAKETSGSPRISRATSAN